MNRVSKKLMSEIKLYSVLVFLCSFCTVYDKDELKTLDDDSGGSADIDDSSLLVEDKDGQLIIDSSVMDTNFDTQRPIEEVSTGDDDGSETENDDCPDDPNKTDPGECGCGVEDSDEDSDGVLDCNDNCASDPDKTEPGPCGCHTPDLDDDSDGVLNCLEECPDDPEKTEPGACGCGIADTDSDNDGLLDCEDSAPYGWQRRLTVDGSQVDTTLTDFPLLVRLQDEHLKSSAAANGDDIHFRAADQTGLLDFELESYDSTSGTIVAWVRMPTLDAGTDSTLFLAYGDGVGDRSNAADVWSEYHYVWHMSQDPEMGNGSIKDAAEHADGTPRGDMTSANRVAAVAGYGISFDGVDDEIAFTNDLTGKGESTIGAWVNQLPDSGDSGSTVVCFGNESQNKARFLLSEDNAIQRTMVGFYSNDIAGVALSTSTWNYLVWSWDGDNSRLYVNGALATGPAAHPGADTTGVAGMIGNTTFTYDRFMTGQLDEVRVATTARSSGWISAEYRNQKPGSTFIKDIESARPIDSP